jgi:glutamate racemase
MIGVFDSGSGGLSILAALKSTLPERRFVYLGDHAHQPYGPRPPEEVLERTRIGAELLFAHGCDVVVLACNTASVLALRTLQESWLPQHHPQRRLLGIFVPVVEALTGRVWRRDDDIVDPEPRFELGVFATVGTIRSGHFRREIERLLPNVRVFEQPCPGLAEAIERNEDQGRIEIAIRSHVAELAAQAGHIPERIILGCTHYPLVRDAFTRALPAGTRIIDQAQIVAASLAGYLARRGSGAAIPGDERYFTTGNPDAVARVVAGLCAGGLAGDPGLREAARWQGVS